MPSRENNRLLIERIARRFRRAKLYFGHGTGRAVDEAAWLVGHVLAVPPEELAARLDVRPGTAQTERIEALAAQRIATRKPLAYLLKEAWFAGRTYYVDERVIVPRSLIAEFILERFAPWVKAQSVRRILDLCTGSGCMAVAAALAFPVARVDAVDLSPDALAVARINLARHQVGERVRLIQSDLFDALGDAHYDIIMTNPPYVAVGELGALPPEYRHEPAMALAAGTDGLSIITRILRQAGTHLSDGGILVAEVGNSQAVLSTAFPDIAFTWLTTEGGDDSVFLLTAAQLGALHRR